MVYELRKRPARPRRRDAVLMDCYDHLPSELLRVIYVAALTARRRHYNLRSRGSEKTSCKHIRY
jgi:hypothetical protein